MNIEVNKIELSFELFPLDDRSNMRVQSIKKRRVLIGRSNACDIVIPFPNISSIHAVLEFKDNNNFRVYDMNSTNGTYINGRSVVAEDLKLGDRVRFASHEFEIRPLSKSDLMPPPLEMLDPDKKVDVENLTRTLPQMPGKLATTEDHVPTVIYPLAKDNKADFTEYIFEDADQLYPIFKYDFAHVAAEIIVLHKDRIHSVDYIPDKDGVYHMVGSNPQNLDIEYPYLGAKEKEPIIEVRGKEIFVYSLPNYDFYSFVKEKEFKPDAPFFVGKDEIVRMKNNDIQIFVRGTEAPPRVASAPVLGRDKDLRKYLLMILLLILLFLGGIALIEVDEEVEKEKAPERVATILYKKKLVLSSHPAIAKTKKAPKKLQRSPKIKEIQKKKEQIPPTKVAPDKKAVKSAKGSKDTKQVGKVKKATPNKGKTVVKDQVRPVTKLNKSSSSRPSTVSQKKAQRTSKAKGNVQTYKSADFSSSLNNLLTKGGSLSKVKSASAGTAGNVGDSSLATSSTGAQAEMAKVTGQVGSVSGAVDGKLDRTKGTGGIFDKGNIYTAGLPYKTVVLGGLDPDVIRQILIANIPQFRGCYQSELNRQNRAFDGRVLLNFVIGASGYVSKATVGSMSTLPVPVKNCVVNVLKGIKFPKPLGGGRVEVKQPFNFYPRVK